MAQPIRWLPCKYEELRPNPQGPVSHVRNHGIRDVYTGEYPESIPPVSEHQHKREICLKN